MVLINDFWSEDYMSLVRGKMPQSNRKICDSIKGTDSLKLYE